VIKRRILMIARLLLAALLIRQGAIGLSDLAHLSQSLQAHNAWQNWPLVGVLRSMEMALWIAAGELAVGMFLLAGLLTRIMALAATMLAVVALGTFSDLGLAATFAHGVLLVVSLAILILGGGSGTLDSELGRMQRRSVEREAKREATRQAAQHS
jgi:uncharacterized membrane protein YphA (DoxX/SURF4 family)